MATTSHCQTPVPDLTDTLVQIGANPYFQHMLEDFLEEYKKAHMDVILSTVLIIYSVKTQRFIVKS